MKRTFNEVGFSQRIQLPWLDYTANLTLSGKDREQVNDALQSYLKAKLSVGGSSIRGTREKVITILIRVWCHGSERTDKLRKEGLELLRRLPPKNHLPIHWCMSMAEYPFWGGVAETVGRLLRLHATVTASQAQRRIREQMGERETVARAARRILRSFIDWGVLIETKPKGTYTCAPEHPVSDPALLRWMIESLLMANGSDWVPLDSVNQHPSLFPFRFDRPHPSLFDCSQRVEVTKQGIDGVIIRAKP